MDREPPYTDEESRRSVLRRCVAATGLLALAGCQSPSAGPGTTTPGGTTNTTPGDTTTAGDTTTPGDTTTTTSTATTTSTTTGTTTNTTGTTTTTNTTGTTTNTTTTTRGELREGTAPFHLTQGNRCLPVYPLKGSQPVEQFYDYRNPYNTKKSSYSYSSHGTVRYQRPNSSILMLYEGPDGTSLVIVHGQYVEHQDSTGGAAASFVIRSLSPTGEWLVQDDQYNKESNVDRWNVDYTVTRVDWTWGNRRTDGGAFGPIGSTNSITIDPAFNQNAALYGVEYSGTVDNWYLVSGKTANPRYFSLDMSESITISPGPCQ